MHNKTQSSLRLDDKEHTNQAIQNYSVPIIMKLATARREIQRFGIYTPL